MLGLMQDWPLLCHRIIDHAATYHPDRRVISRSIEGPIHTTTYAAVRKRALKVAQRLDRDGIKQGDRVATLPVKGSLRSKVAPLLAATASPSISILMSIASSYSRASHTSSTAARFSTRTACSAAAIAASTSSVRVTVRA